MLQVRRKKGPQHDTTRTGERFSNLHLVVHVHLHLGDAGHVHRDGNVEAGHNARVDDMQHRLPLLQSSNRHAPAADGGRHERLVGHGGKHARATLQRVRRNGLGVVQQPRLLRLDQRGGDHAQQQRVFARRALRWAAHSDNDAPDSFTVAKRREPAVETGVLPGLGNDNVQRSDAAVECLARPCKDGRAWVGREREREREKVRKCSAK